MHYPTIPRFASAIRIKAFPSGQRRTAVNPAASLLRDAFDELGTHVAVAGAFGVSRTVVKRWLEKYGMTVVSRPEVRYSNSMRARLSALEDQEAVAQWLMDEGSVTVAFLLRTNSTIMLVCGSMGDYDVLTKISGILGIPITSARLPSETTLPMGAVRVQGARAYALLQILMPRLTGLKRAEAQSALHFFPPSGILKGRHTTDELFIADWLDHARKSLHEWNKRRRIKVGEEELETRARTWVKGRTKRARRFIDPGSGLVN